MQASDRFTRIACTALIITLAVLSYAFIEPYRRIVKTYEIGSSDLPANFHGKKIVFVSDISCGPTFSVKRVRDLVEEINDLDPDIVLLGGDYSYKSEANIRPCFKELAELKSKYKFGVLGDRDYWYGKQTTMQEMFAADIKPLVNSGEWIDIAGQKIKICGVDDLWTGNPDLKPIIKDTSEKDFVVLISHNPDFVDQIDNGMIDLVLSGHTRGGQISFFGWTPMVPVDNKKYTSGMVETTLTKLIVSSGVSSIPVAVRFWCRPDIVQVIFK